MSMIWQQSLQREFLSAGIGLHSGRRVRVRVRPAPPDTGIIVRRVDVPCFSARATGALVADVDHATTISLGGKRLRTVEHLLSALRGMGIDNAILEAEGDEIPILDGSAAPFVAQIHQAGIRMQSRRRKFLRIRNMLHLSTGRKSVDILPAEDFRITYTIDFDHPRIGRQTKTFRTDPVFYQEEIAPARTFVMYRDVETLRKHGLARGGSLENAIVLTDDAILNEGLRFEDEFLRHKVLDCIGDFSLLGYPLLGHVVVRLGGHGLHTRMVKKILQSPGDWDLVTLGGSEERSPLRPVSARFRALAGGGSAG